MKSFQMRELHDAIEYAVGGGQAIHLHTMLPARAPQLFRRAVERGEQLGHFFDQDRKRLVETVRSLGVRSVCVEHEGTPRQHVDLVGAPLKRALALCEEGKK